MYFSCEINEGINPPLFPGMIQVAPTLTSGEMPSLDFYQCNGVRVFLENNDASIAKTQIPEGWKSDSELLTE